MCNAVSSMTITLLMVENNNVAIIDILAYFCQFLSDKKKKTKKKRTTYFQIFLIANLNLPWLPDVTHWHQMLTSACPLFPSNVAFPP